MKGCRGQSRSHGKRWLEARALQQKFPQGDGPRQDFRLLLLAFARLAVHPFGHGAIHLLGDGRHVIDSYHCSRYNTNTGRLTPEMFADVFRLALALRDQTSGPNSSTSPR